MLLKHCSTAFRKHWGAGETQDALGELQCCPSPSFPAHACPQHQPTFLLGRMEEWLSPCSPDCGGQRDQSPEAVCDEPGRSVQHSQQVPVHPTWHFHLSTLCCPLPSPSHPSPSNSTLFLSVSVRVSLPRWPGAVSPSQLSVPRSQPWLPHLFSTYSSAQLAGDATPGATPQALAWLPSCSPPPPCCPQGPLLHPWPLLHPLLMAPTAVSLAHLAWEMGNHISSDVLGPPLLGSRD